MIRVHVTEKGNEGQVSSRPSREGGEVSSYWYYYYVARSSYLTLFRTRMYTLGEKMGPVDADSMVGPASWLRIIILSIHGS